MFLDGLNELDQKILSLLIENARLSYSGDRGEGRALPGGRKRPESREWRRAE